MKKLLIVKNRRGNLETGNLTISEIEDTRPFHEALLILQA